MLRIFGHFVPLPALALGLCECLLLCAAFYLVTAPVDAWHLPPAVLPAQAAVGIALVALVVMAAVGLYQTEVFLDGRQMAIKVGAALLLIAPAAAAVGFISTRGAADPVGIGWAMWCVRTSVAWIAAVLATRCAVLRLFDIEPFRRPVVVLGIGARAKRIAALGNDGLYRSFSIRGFVRSGGDPALVAGAALDLDREADEHGLSRYVAAMGAREVVVATDERRGMPIAQLLHCKIAGINVVDHLTFWERETRTVDLDWLQPSWLIYSDGFRQGRLVDAAKRTLDLAASLLLLAFVLPVLAVAVAAIKLEDGGSILYRQERVGRAGRHFTLMKLRSMHENAERDGAPQWARCDDPRTTRIGAILRKFRIDELPQLINVLRGEMSFVGPRPERPFFVADLAKAIPFYLERHSVKPGITGWAQVNYPYGASLEDARHKLGYDLYYVKNRTLFLDMLILVQTVRVILFHEGAR